MTTQMYTSNYILVYPFRLIKNKNVQKNGEQIMDVNKRYYILRAYMTIHGVKYYAKDYGKRAFKIYINR